MTSPPVNNREQGLILIVPLLAAIGPFLVWPVEQFLPYPYLVEEIYKAVLIYQILTLPKITLKLLLTILIGLLFSLTETIFYFFNILPTGETNTLITRITLTTFLHILTSVVILSPALKKKQWVILGVLSSMLIHYLYNYQFQN